MKSCQHVTTQSDNTLNEPEVLPTTIEDIIKETKVGYIKLDSEIEINATPSDIVVVMLGGSGGPDGDNPLGGTGMTKQGFKLIDLAGDSDCRIEGWVKIWDANDGHLNPIKDMLVPLHVGGTGLTLVALMFDDSLVNLSVIEGNGDVPIYWVDGPRADKGFGDGDSFGFMVMEGDEVTRMSGENGTDPGTDYSEITINFDGWLIY